MTGARNQPVLVRDVDGEHGVVRVISMNRPDKRNAMNTEMLTLLVSELHRGDDEARVAAMMLTGEGGGFSGGGDIGEFGPADDPRLKMERARLMGELFLLPQRLGTPVVAAALGPAVGGGAALALAADMVVAGDDLRLGFPELARGIIPTAVMVGLSRRLGSRVAFELLVTGRLLDAAEALDLRLVNRVVASDATFDTALELAALTAGIDAVAMRTTKRLFHRGNEMPDAAAMDAGMDVLRDRWLPVGEA